MTMNGVETIYNADTRGLKNIHLSPLSLAHLAMPTIQVYPTGRKTALSTVELIYSQYRKKLIYTLQSRPVV